MRFVIPILALLLVACGGPDPTPVNEASIVEGSDFDTNYTLVTQESELRFTATQESKPFEGRFGAFDADIRFDPDDLDGSRVRVRVPLVSVEAGSADRNSTLPGEAWFDTKRFPVAIFESRDIARTGDDYAAMGMLSLKGLEAETVVFFTLSEDDQGRTVMRGDAALDRTDWAVGAAPWDTEEYVGHTVELDIELVAVPD